MEKFTIPNVYKVSAAFFITGCILLVAYLASDIFAPLIMALLLAILLRPIAKFLNEKLKFPSLLAVSITVVLTFLILIGVVAFLGYQLTQFFDDLPMIKRNLTMHYHSAQKWVWSTFGLSYGEQKQYLEQNVSGSTIISASSISSITNGFMYIILIPIYTFLILIYRSFLQI
jgi:predicted PurR-regulated permease PerM